MATCSKCNKASDVYRVLKCVQCFKAVCEKCATRRYAKVFCSDNCARFFFYDGAEEE
jgi:hypothetical protein